MNDLVKAADDVYASQLCKGAADPYHSVFPKFRRRCAATPGTVLLEIGAREVSGVSRRNDFGRDVCYIGMDIHPGPGVNVVADAHGLSSLFPANHFDAICAISVFEHLAFPWKVVMEMNAVLKHGGVCYVSTHPVWPPHELPWDFWRFPIAGLRALFSEPLGFRIVEAAEGLPGRVHSLVDDLPTRGLPYHPVSLGVAVMAEKIGDYDRERLRWDLPLSAVLDSVYPKR